MSVVRSARVEYMLRRSCGLLVSRRFARGRLGRFSVSPTAGDIEASAIEPAQLSICLTVLDAGESLFESFAPVIQRAIRRSGRSFAPARTADGPRTERVLATPPVRCPMPEVDRMWVARAIVELDAHVCVLGRDLDARADAAPSSFRELLLSWLSDLCARTRYLLDEMEKSQLFPIAHARSTLHERWTRIAKARFCGNTGSFDGARPRMERYARETIGDFTASVSEPAAQAALAVDLLAWRRARLSKPVRLGAGDVVLQDYPQDESLLFRIWCAYELGHELTERGDLARTLGLHVRHDASADPTRSEPTRAFDCIAESGRGGSYSGRTLREVSLDLSLCGADRAPIVIHVHDGPWSVVQHALAIGYAVECGAAAAVVIVSDDIPSGALRASDGTPRFVRCSVPAGAIPTCVARLVPSHAFEPENEAVLAELIEHVLA